MHPSIPLSLATNSIVSEMYTRDNPQAIAYSNKLNMLLVSKVLISSNYYDYRYPVYVKQNIYIV